MSKAKLAALLLPPCIAILVIVGVDLSPGNPLVTIMLAIALWMAAWWASEAVPLAATALLPLILFPLFGVSSGKSVASAYINSVVFLFIGGFLVAIAMERWQVHKRIALRILMLFGSSPKALLAGFMIATAFLSMWISNTATTMMMVPIVLAILSGITDMEEQARRRFSIGLLLGVAYGASIGGTATLIGTPPNAIFTRLLTITFVEAPQISFGQWLLFALPLSTTFLFLAWLLLCKLFAPTGAVNQSGRDHFRQLYKKLGVASYEEKIVLGFFLSLALLWIFRADLELGFITLPGWSALLGHPDYIDDGTVAILVASLLFVIPSRNEPGKRLLDNDCFARLPWHIVLLFGGGFALAQGFSDSGLSVYLSEKLSLFNAVHPLVIVAATALFMTFLTELTSNTATTQMLLPILAAMAVAIGVNPLLLMIPATLSASFAFMLPVATPPNAIIFGTNHIRIMDMARTGIWLNLIGVLLVTLATTLWGQFVFDIDLTQIPDWAVLRDAR